MVVAVVIMVVVWKVLVRAVQMKKWRSCHVTCFPFGT